MSIEKKMAFKGTTLEEFLEDQCGMVTPGLLDLLEPHRAFVEHALTEFYDGKLPWKEFAKSLWKFLPHPTTDHYK